MILKIICTWSQRFLEPLDKSFLHTEHFSAFGGGFSVHRTTIFLHEYLYKCHENLTLYNSVRERVTRFLLVFTLLVLIVVFRYYVLVLNKVGGVQRDLNC